MTKKCKGTGSCDFVTLKSASCPVKCSPFQLDDSESAFFDSIAQEHVQAHGTELYFWHQDLEESTRDPLYDEPIDREWRGPYKIMGWVEYMAGQPQMREEGMVVRWEGRIWIARAELEEKGAPAPLEGDVLKFWDNTFFEEHGVNAEEGVHGGYYFDVINADDDGHVFDTGHFVGIVLNVLRRTEFTPERRLDS